MDHVAHVPRLRFVVDVVPNARTIESTERLVAAARRRTGGRIVGLLTSDACPACEPAIRHAYGEVVRPPHTDRPGRPRGSTRRLVPEGPTYAFVVKVRKGGPGGAGRQPGGLREIGGGGPGVGDVGGEPGDQQAFIEREEGTARHRNARKVRRCHRFSEDWRFHEAATYSTRNSYDSCSAVRTQRVGDGRGGWAARSPAMAAGLTDPVWSVAEWLSYPVMHRSSATTRKSGP